MDDNLSVDTIPTIRGNANSMTIRHYLKRIPIDKEREISDILLKF